MENKRPETVTVTMSLLEWRVVLDALAYSNAWLDENDQDRHPRNWAVKNIMPKYAYACDPKNERYNNVPLSTLVQLQAIHVHDYETNEYFTKPRNEWVKVDEK